MWHPFLSKKIGMGFKTPIPNNPHLKRKYIYRIFINTKTYMLSYTGGSNMICKYRICCEQFEILGGGKKRLCWKSRKEFGLDISCMNYLFMLWPIKSRLQLIGKAGWESNTVFWARQFTHFCFPVPPIQNKTSWHDWHHHV